MLQTLLWACPICGIHDAITHLERRFRHDLVTCSVCNSQWELIRVVGGPDFRMRMISGNNGNPEKPLSKWYDQMMENFTLSPIDSSSWFSTSRDLSQEVLFLTGEVLMALALPEDPLFKDPDLKFPQTMENPMGMRPMGPGQLLITSHNLICELSNSGSLCLPWSELSSVDTLMDRIFNVGYKEREFSFILKNQSVLKWLAHTRKLLGSFENNGHRIYQGYL